MSTQVLGWDRHGPSDHHEGGVPSGTKPKEAGEVPPSDSSKQTSCVNISTRSLCSSGCTTASLLVRTKNKKRPRSAASSSSSLHPHAPSPPTRSPSLGAFDDEEEEVDEQEEEHEEEQHRGGALSSLSPHRKRARPEPVRRIEKRVLTAFKELDLLLRAERINRRVMVRKILPDAETPVCLSNWALTSTCPPILAVSLEWIGAEQCRAGRGQHQLLYVGQGAPQAVDRRRHPGR